MVKSNVMYIVSFAAGILFSMQASAQHEEKDVILRAMQDELERSMKELSLPGYDKPFFIHYGVRSVESQSIIASMGALYRSATDRGRDKSVRILVGDYEFNDESLDDDLTSSPEANEIDLPLEDDYYGIRRAFWATTDNVYRNAAKHFARNQATLKDQKKPLSEIPHRRFAQAPPVQLIQPVQRVAVDNAKWEAYCRQVSVKFNGLKEVNYSGVVFSFIQGENYMVNSEGSRVRTPFSIASLMISAQGRTESGENVMEQIVHQAKLPDGLPSLDSIQKEVDRMIEKMKNTASVPVWEDPYTGPVLFIGPSASELLAGHILYGRESLADNNNIPSLRGYQVENGNPIESKIGKQLFSELMTVKATPKLKTFQGQDLLGAYDVDDEGVVPPDELVLIDNGVLKGIFNDRTLTSADQKATGHASGPGVLQIDFAGGIPLEKLKQKLLDQAKADGLDYAVIVRANTLGRSGPTTVYRVSVADGKEEMYRGATIEGLSNRAMRRIVSTSSERVVHTIQSGSGTGALSVIGPSAILFEDLDVTESQLPSYKDEVFVESPLEKETN